MQCVLYACCSDVITHVLPLLSPQVSTVYPHLCASEYCHMYCISLAGVRCKTFVLRGGCCLRCEPDKLAFQYVMSSLHFLIELVRCGAVLLWLELLLQQLGTCVHTYRCAAAYGMCPMVHYRAGVTSGQPAVCIAVNMWLLACDELYRW